MDGLHYEAFSKEQKIEIGEQWLKRYQAWRYLVDPVFWGHEHVSASQPALWVGNHSMMAFADASLMVSELYQRHGIVLRSLAQHLHFKVPVWKKWLINNLELVYEDDKKTIKRKVKENGKTNKDKSILA